jgi:Metallo-peptidase family M12B Reprolysin-like/Ig-like domain CHU_C associated
MSKISIFTLLFFCATFQVLAQSNDPFKFNLSIGDEILKVKNAPKVTEIGKSAILAEISTSTIDLPLPDGSYKKFKVVSSEVMDKKLKDKYPDINTFRIFSASKKENLFGTLTVSQSGLHAIIFTEEGDVLIHPTNAYASQYTSSFQNLNELAAACGVETTHLSKRVKDNKKSKVASILESNGATLRTFRIAIITTGEFYTNNGATLASAQTAVVSIINSLKAVYEKELAVTFNLVATKIYTDPALDPFNGSSASTAASAFGALSLTEPADFALSNYDIGHVLHHSPGGGGVAYLGAVCSDYNINGANSPIKAGGYSGVSLANVSTLVHEVGHMFDAGHTFNSVTSNCNGNIMVDYAVEPGSGSTFMSYFSSCGADNLSGASGRSYFHAASVEDMLYFIQNYTNCSTSSPTLNTPPVIDALSNKTIPKGTPFKLSGSATDVSGQSVYYNWEQMDIAPYNNFVRGGADDAQNSQFSPIFRSLEPTLTGNIRIFPKLSQILSLASKPDNDEALPQSPRLINMRLTARDNVAGGGARDYKDLVLTVDNSGPFLITSQNVPNVWVVGDSKTITWSVNGTNLAPLNVANVNILMSSDGGNTFPTVLASATPNDGSQVIIVPNIVSAQVRIKIEPSSTSHIFFDINNSNISVVTSFTCVSDVSEISSIPVTSFGLGSPDLNLNIFGHKPVTSLIVSTTTIDPYVNLTGKSTTGVCGTTSNTLPYKKTNFKVSASGNYTFTKTVGNGAINIYKYSFDPANPCLNWIGGSMVLTSTGTNTPLVQALTLDSIYVIVFTIGTNAGSTGTNTVTISGPGSFLSGLPLPISNYDYAYVISNTTNTILAINSKADLSNATIFPVGVYTVRGLSYLAGVDLSTFVGQPISALQNSFTTTSNCGSFSTNSRTITITCSAPAKPVSNNVSICNTQAVNLSATNCSGVFNWYATAVGGTSLSALPNFTSPVLSTSTTYYVDCTVNACTSSRTSVLVSINNAIAPVLENSNIISGTSATITANGCTGGLINWYETQTGSVVLGTGTTFTSAILNYPLESKKYYASCTIGTCVSPTRSEATVTVCNNSNLVLVSPLNNISTAGVINNKTNGIITASNKINTISGTVVTFNSLKSITLNPGFEVISVNGSSFKAFIEGCVN